MGRYKTRINVALAPCCMGSRWMTEAKVLNALGETSENSFSLSCWLITYTDIKTNLQ